MKANDIFPGSGHESTTGRLIPLAAAMIALVAVTTGAQETDGEAGLELLAEGFVAPLALQEIPDGSATLLVADQAGTIYRVSKENGEKSVFLDLTDKRVDLRTGFDERGLLGIALHPDFLENRRFFVYHSAPLREGGMDGFDHTSHVSEFRATENLEEAEADSERVLLQIDEPQFNHNGGALLFGNDGYLYIGVGDGGAARDVGTGHPPKGNGQDTTTLLGSVLRIDVDNGEPYAIPPDNPFIDSEGADEIFAYGLRNVWGLSRDRDNPDRIFAADVGQHLYEEVNLLQNGGNYGWNVREGFHCFDPDEPREPPEDCPETGEQGEPLINPLFEYKNTTSFSEREEEDAYGVCVIGGYVYRGDALPHLNGSYLFGDWSSNWGQPQGALLVASPPEGESDRSSWEVRRFTPATHPEGQLDGFLLGIGEDADGELYFMTNGNQGPTEENGKVYRLVRREG